MAPSIYQLRAEWTGEAEALLGGLFRPKQRVLGEISVVNEP